MNAYHVIVIFIDRQTKYILSAAADIRFALSESMAFSDYAAQIRINLSLNGHDATKYIIVPVRVSRLSEQLIQSAYIMVLSKSLAAFESHKSTVELQNDQNDGLAVCAACGDVGHTWEHCAVLSALRSQPRPDGSDSQPDGPSTPPGPFKDFFGTLGDMFNDNTE